MSNDNKQKQRRSGNHMGGGRFGTGEKAKDFKGTMKQLFAYIGRYRIHLGIVMFFAILSTVFFIAGPKILGQATTELANGLFAKVNGSGGINFGKIQNVLLLLLGMYLFSMLCAYVQNFVMATISQNIAFKMRNDLTEKINRLPLSYFDKTSQGDVLSRVTNDIDTIGQSLNQSMAQLVTSSVQLIGIAIMMFTISWLMTLVALIVFPISALAVSQIVKHTQRYFASQQQSLGMVNGHVEEMYGGHIVVKAFNGEEESVKEFSEYNDKLYTSAWKSQFFSGLMQPLIQFVGNIGYVFVCLLGGVLAINDSITLVGITFTGIGIAIGDIQAFIQYVRQFNQPIAQMAQVMNMMQLAAASSERVFAFLNEPEMEPETDHPIEIYDENKQIVIPSTVMFDQVEFGYDPDKIIIHNFNLRVGEGQKVAIVGPTGAGKTTIVKLLMRFYELNNGAIYVGDHDIRDYRRSDLRSMFGMVLQDAWLFNGTVMENLRYSKLEASDEEVYAAAKAARVDHFVKTLEHGYETVLNEETSNISQGQKQLLTIARAFLADPKILILDEATSNVDTRTEVLIQEGMDNLMKGRTSFVIAHRLSTIRNANVIIVMNEGDIVEIGDHEELLARGGFYAKLYNSQFEEGEE